MPKLRFIAPAMLALSLIAGGCPPVQAGMAVKSDIPYRQDTGLSKAEYLISRGKHAAAIHELDNVIKRHPKSADAWSYKAFSTLQLGDKKKAMSYFKRALQIDPTHLGANKYLASLYLDAGQLSFAMEQMQVIRMICGAMQCDELDDLEREVDAYKDGERVHAKEDEGGRAATADEEGEDADSSENTESDAQDGSLNR
jgi:Tfp pilus assembly protein PilF